MKRKIIIALVVVGAVFAGLAGVKALQIGKLIGSAKTFTVPPETISSAVAQEQKWQDTLTAVGSISAAQGVTVAAEVAGTVTEIAFESGAVVAKGDLLVRLDTSSEAAQLRAAEAEAELTRLNLDRLLKLRESNVVSQSEVDTAEAALKQNQANADAIRAIIEKKTIRAPFAGRLGIRLVNLGESLEARKPIVSLQSLVPVYGDFSLPQQTLSVLQTGLVVQVSSDAYPGEKFIGEVTAINPELDSTTRAVRLQATFANTNQLLRPGMFVRMEIVLPGEQTVLAVPATAILSAPFGDSVYVIEQSTNSAGGLVARQQFVRTGRPLGDFVSIVTGLKPGDRVVSSGLFKLRNGSGVVVNNEIAPKSSTTPNPPNG
ncbi:MAG: efflux RND transporter periplasmic adaptor subunit [Verrucomicrobiales bacterium]|nr:efflux RND transporter periplasmic adaptor subunit [Verrucomicrobiales bacterium]